MEEKYQITIGVDTEQKLTTLFEESQAIWDKVGVTMTPNEEAKKVIESITKKAD